MKECVHAVGKLLIIALILAGAVFYGLCFYVLVTDREYVTHPSMKELNDLRSVVEAMRNYDGTQ